jgi:predicted MFS family arabinose efflux permease
MVREVNDYTVGTLCYKRWDLINLFIWLLLGDFAFVMMGNAFSQLLPITMKTVGSNNFIISLSMIALPCVINLVFLPIISTWSDRHRGRFGRRIPFIFWPTPFISLFLVLFGYSDLIGAWFHGTAIGKLFGFSSFTIIMTIMCANLILFQFFNLFVSTIYYYLWVDVIPTAFMGRFIALFRMVGQLSIFIWSRYFLGYADQYMHEIYLGVGFLYLFSFMIMSWKVKEGKYPPPPSPSKQKGVFGSIQMYFRECFSHPIYVCIYLASGLYWTSWCMNAFMILFATETLHLKLDQFGKVNSWCSLMAIPLLYGLGYVSDKIHSVRMNLIAMVMTFFAAGASFFGIHNERTLLIFSLLNAFTVLCYTISNVPLTAALYPKERYGQFGSAEGIVMSIGTLVGGAVIGLLLDWVGSYQYIFLWRAVLCGLAIIPLTIVYYEWQKHGGAKHYVSPDVDESVKSEETLTISVSMETA